MNRRLAEDQPYRKSTFSPDAGGCVEVGVERGTVRVRDTKNPDGATLTFNALEWDSFVKGVKAGEFDFPA